MPSRADIAQRESRAAAEFLDGIGEHKHAQAVRNLSRSVDTYKMLTQSFHRDIMKLRAELNAAKGEQPPESATR